MSIEDPFPQNGLKCLNKPINVKNKKTENGYRLRKVICILYMHGRKKRGTLVDLYNTHHLNVAFPATSKPFFNMRWALIAEFLF